MSPPGDDELPSEEPDGSGGGGTESGGSDARGPDAAGPTTGDDPTDPSPSGFDPDGRADAPSESQAGGERGEGTDVAVNGGAPTADAAPTRHGDAEAAESTAESGARTFLIDVVSSALAVLLVGALLFAVSGVWPPMVAIESSSMAPHMNTGDLVFVMDEQRFPGDGEIAGTGVVTLRSGQDSDYRQFQRPGDVIVYKPNGDDGATPIIHRAMFYVQEGENWYEEADRQSIGRYSECGESTEEALPYCPAPHAGFITKGDANGGYDQAQPDPLSAPVKAEWVVGTAEVRIPKLGCIRLRNERCLGAARAATTDTGQTVDATLAAGAANRSAVAP
ncbi:signal sequence peptidase [Halosimplex carlsbadense 2-9-1]|uniref:Signal sequence peptidase n=1 Tax=Halosimplex carlsbadense 2-9-1 TaxID=797114 RepID=M0D3S7_9EURY|nr:S26 family signal peptidase [Halosimplex carlsbadense]ELZ29347.1 signal sequence peptidase [Halosimplex carlsbadense 2-9-1]